MLIFTPAQLEALTGLSVSNQRAWERQGLFLGRSERTAGGQRRFKLGDVLFVASVRAMAEMGFELKVCAHALDRCLGDVSDALRGRPNLVGSSARDAVFIWHDGDSTDEGSYSGDLLGQTGYRVIRLNDLNRIRAFSKSGGAVFFPRDLARKIPPAVADYFLQETK